jgi:hypothetical protein
MAILTSYPHHGGADKEAKMIVTMIENGVEIMKRKFSNPDDGFAWIKSNRYGWEPISATECVSSKRPDCKLIISGEF